jgi:hypothetical protein
VPSIRPLPPVKDVPPNTTAAIASNSYDIPAVGGNEKAAFISGIKVNKLKIMIYSLAGLMSAMAGAVKDVPPNTTAAIASNSYDIPAVGCAEFKRDVRIAPNLCYGW